MWYTLSKKMINMMTIKYVSYILLLIELMAYTNGFSQYDSTKTKCVEDNNKTFTCNFIPKTLPVGVTTVHLNLSLVGNMYLNKSTFIDHSWNKVKLLEINVDLPSRAGHLILQDYCFNGLEQLKELRMHMECSFYTNPNTFLGVKDVGVLDLSRSVQLTLKDLIPALNGSDKLPELNKLILSKCSRDSQPLSFDNQLIDVLQSKKIQYLDVSSTDIKTINFTAVFKRLAFLEVLDASYSNIGFFISSYLEQGDMKRIKFVDLSFVNLPKKVFHLPPGRLVIENTNTSFSKLSNQENAKLFLTPEIVNASGIIPHVSSIWIKNVNFTVDVDPLTFTKELIMRQNNLRWLDVNVICENFKFSSFSRMDLSENGMQFLHPNLLSCFPNLQKLDLSSNQLVKMSRENIGLFETLFSGLRYLKKVNMSKNSLNTLPKKIFENNRNIEIIDLSGNLLDQVHITLAKLSRLTMLNLYGNNIHVLDQMSIYNLNSISYGNVSDIRKIIVILKANPISCSECKELSFLVWLTSTNLVDLDSQQLICYNEKDETEIITQETVKKVKLICRRKVIITATSILAGCILLILIISLLIFYIRRKHRKRLQNRANVINLLRQGDGNYEFAVFLAFSNEDEDFVNTHILHQLNENLQLMTGVDRELVCTGDRHFRPGFYVQNETCRRLATASVLIVVASENFCQSVYCRGELEQAFMEGKPIILMFIEQVEQELMPPTMREVYQRNVRIVWTFENGEYKMKTTWENVCKSVLDLIK
ncbi:toll-like receptor 4 [Ruditapes philippinarum]|uniref:toll-like receptor 4 n=1 Tax=Ruditapes philippinarum TaxID=129788 RepID=UPI00295B59C2|nr:toll-like receptor 4 [Ruditapes philippinarum]